MCHTSVPAGQAEIEVERQAVEIPVGDGDMPATLAGSGDGPGVLVIADMYGPSPFYAHLSGILAQAGFRALLPDYFFRQGALETQSPAAAFARRRELDEANAVAELSRAVDWLAGSGGSTRVGVVGFCMGGTFALDLASERSDLVTVSYYGFPVPQAELSAPPPRPIDVVDSQSGPVLAFWGDQDQVVGADNVAAYTERATKANAGFSFEVLAGLGHGFLAAADLEDGSDPAAATWQRTLTHLTAGLMR